jgi:uncharacterized protein
VENKQYYFVRLLGKRPGWPEDMMPAEEEIMGEHFEYLKKLVAEKRVVMAGPVWKPTFGMMILRVDSEEEALAILKDEPSVVKGLHNYEMQSMILSLLMENP